MINCVSIFMSLGIEWDKILFVYFLKKKNIFYLLINFFFFDYSKVISFIINVCIYVEFIYVYVFNKEGF